MRLLLSTWIVLTSVAYANAAENRLPNVVVIMTDNHGAWTLGCYGNKDIRTPNIDRLASEGMLFTRAYACNAVCSPTRATFFTGLMPSQHGVHCFLRARNLQVGPEAKSTIAEYRTLPEVLNNLGYVCGLVGKWHLGDNLKPQEGFSTWVTMPHGGTREFYNQKIIEDGKIRDEATYLTKYWTDRGCHFITKNKDRRFFLCLTYNGPYGLGRSMLNPPKNRHRDHYEGKQFTSFPREKMHPWLHSTKELHNNKTSIWRYACEISAVDDGVGRIMKTLHTNNLDKNTLVIFLADQGLSGGHSGIWGMGDHTRPLSAFWSTMHIPLIFRHKGHIPAGKKSDIMVANYDLFTTIVHYLGKGKKAPAKSPGRNFAPILNCQQIEWENIVFYEFENIRAVRTPKWNYVERVHEKPRAELYNLIEDPDERKNLAGKTSTTAIERRLHRRIKRFFEKYADPKWNLWKGGSSKTFLLNAQVWPDQRKPKDKKN